MKNRLVIPHLHPVVLFNVKSSAPVLLSVLDVSQLVPAHKHGHLTAIYTKKKKIQTAPERLNQSGKAANVGVLIL